jgi:hypothetical protein
MKKVTRIIYPYVDYPLQWVYFIQYDELTLADYLQIN